MDWPSDRLGALPTQTLCLFASFSPPPSPILCLLTSLHGLALRSTRCSPHKISGSSDRSSIRWTGLIFRGLHTRSQGPRTGLPRTAPRAGLPFRGPLTRSQGPQTGVPLGQTGVSFALPFRQTGVPRPVLHSSDRTSTRPSPHEVSGVSDHCSTWSLPHRPSPWSSPRRSFPWGGGCPSQGFMHSVEWLRRAHTCSPNDSDGLTCSQTGSRARAGSRALTCTPNNSAGLTCSPFVCDFDGDRLGLGRWPH